MSRSNLRKQRDTQKSIEKTGLPWDKDKKLWTLEELEKAATLHGHHHRGIAREALRRLRLQKDVVELAVNFAVTFDNDPTALFDACKVYLDEKERLDAERLLAGQ